MRLAIERKSVSASVISSDIAVAATTERLFDVCVALGLDPQALPKLGDYARCRRCGRCVLGCPNGAKWDARRFLDDAVGRGARVETGCTVDSLVLRGDRAIRR